MRDDGLGGVKMTEITNKRGLRALLFTSAPKMMLIQNLFLCWETICHPDKIDAIYYDLGLIIQMENIIVGHRTLESIPNLEGREYMKKKIEEYQNDTIVFEGFSQCNECENSCFKNWL